MGFNSGFKGLIRDVVGSGRNPISGAIPAYAYREVNRRSRVSAEIQTANFKNRGQKCCRVKELSQTLVPILI